MRSSLKPSLLKLSIADLMAIVEKLGRSTKIMVLIGNRFYIGIIILYSHNQFAAD